MDRDSSVGIATHHGADGPEINPCEGEIFRTHPDGLWGSAGELYNDHQVSLQGVKRLGRGVEHPLSPSAGVKEKVELYLYFPCRPSWHVEGRTVP